LEELSGLRFAGAPLEEYLFAITFGALCAPLYEAWKDEKQYSLAQEPNSDPPT
jgi:hypothetical protein